MIQKYLRHLKAQGPLIGRDPLIASIRSQGLTYLDYKAMLDLKQLVLECDQDGIQGDIIEAGCALGGSAILMAKTKTQARNLAIYDVFGMIPPPGEKDDQDVHERYETITKGESKGIEGGAYYGYENELFEKVSTSFTSNGVPAEEHNVKLVKGLFEDTLNPTAPVALAHLDCDWYDSVMVCLDRIAPHMVSGGRFVIDDYDAWSGARHAADDFLKNHSDFRLERRARVHLVKL